MESTFKVPIRNLFYLLSYANEMPNMVESLNQVEDDMITYDFLVNQFHKEVKQLFRRRLVKDYVTVVEETNNLGGRVLMDKSLVHMMGRKPVVVCEKDSYLENNLLNQVMKATLENIHWNQFVSENYRRESYHFLEELVGVSRIALTKEIFLRLHIHRHNQHYKRMIQLAYLLHELQLLSHKKGNWSMFSTEVDDRELSSIFEKFLFHFYRLEQKDFRVHSERMEWKLEGDKTYLPSMLTDVSLTHRNELRKIIIDAKFYKTMFQTYHDNRSFHSGHMYQLFTYLQHQDRGLEEVRGILIYPYNGDDLHEVYRWNERITMEVMTVDLGAKWEEIKEELIGIIV